jgi:glycosyltransferase involved in cell wall biosynthesis
MQICYDYQIFAAQRYGGISRYFVEIASRVPHFPGAQVRVIAPLYKNNLLEEKSAVIPVTGMYYPRHFLGEYLVPRFDMALSRMLFMYKPDIVHETYYSRRKTTSSQAKTVVTVYDTIEELFPQYFPASKATIEVRKVVFRRAAHIICISHSTRNDLIRLYGINPEKVSVVHLASSLTAPTESLAGMESPFFLYVGNRGGYKNFLGLLDAFALSGLYKSHKLISFGGPQFQPNEQAKILQLGIPGDRVVWVEGGDALLSRYYAAAEAFIYPSLYEGFGIPLLEAMECACPVICGNSSSIPEVAGDAALYFDAADTQKMAETMLTIVQSQTIRQQLIAKGKSRLKQFSWDACAQETYSVYERVLSK